MNEVSIVVPAYNEENGIGPVINQIHDVLKASGFTYEIIVVDDGSEDKTALIASKVGDIKLIQHSQNKGYGEALKTGIKNARYDIITITDADGTYPNGDIPKLLNDIDKHDMVVGARTGDNVRIPLIRRPAKFFINRLANYLAEVKIPDLNSGLRAFKKDIALKFFRVLPSGFSFTTTITLAMLCNGFSVKYIPIDYYKRTGKSKINPFRDTLNFLQLIVRIVMYFNPLKVFIPISIFLLFSGLALLGHDLFVVQNIGDKTVLLLLSSIQVAIIGMLADLIDKRMQLSNND